MEHIINLKNKINSMLLSLLLYSLLLTLLLLMLMNINLYSQIASPNLIYPEKGQVFEYSPTEFIWNKVPNATMYNIQITTDVTFLKINQNFDIDDIHIDTIYYPSKQLITYTDTLYFWRVNSKDANNTSAWSNIRFFTTGKKDNIYENIKYSGLSVNIYPMPVESASTISISINNDINLSKSVTVVKLYLFDSNAELVGKLGELQVVEPINELVITASNYSSGVYTLLLVNEKSEILSIMKIIIKK